jgi:hypothetical protein
MARDGLDLPFPGAEQDDEQDRHPNAGLGEEGLDHVEQRARGAARTVFRTDRRPRAGRQSPQVVQAEAHHQRP